MLSRRCRLHGLFAVLLALMTQLAVGASVPRPDPAARIADAVTLCHGGDDAGSALAKAPAHPVDCLACSLCIAAHPQVPLVPELPKLTPPSIPQARRAELPPPSRAPPFRVWLPIQPRAPPAAS